MSYDDQVLVKYQAQVPSSMHWTNDIAVTDICAPREFVIFAGWLQIEIGRFLVVTKMFWETLDFLRLDSQAFGWDLILGRAQKKLKNHWRNNHHNPGRVLRMWQVTMKWPCRCALCTILPCTVHADDMLLNLTLRDFPTTRHQTSDPQRPCHVCLYEAKTLGLDGQEQLLSKDEFWRVERYVESRDACVGGRQVTVVGRPHGHTRHWLKSLLTRRQSRAWCPEVHLPRNNTAYFTPVLPRLPAITTRLTSHLSSLHLHPTACCKEHGRAFL